MLGGGGGGGGGGGKHLVTTCYQTISFISSLNDFRLSKLHAFAQINTTTHSLNFLFENSIEKKGKAKKITKAQNDWKKVFKNLSF